MVKVGRAVETFVKTGLRGAKARTQIFPRSRSLNSVRSLSCRPLFLSKLPFAQNGKESNKVVMIKQRAGVHSPTGRPPPFLLQVHAHYRNAIGPRQEIYLTGCVTSVRAETEGVKCLPSTPSSCRFTFDSYTGRWDADASQVTVRMHHFSHRVKIKFHRPP